MSSTGNSVSVKPTPFSSWSWILTMFGTAVGAGILYLPIEVGITGLWSLVFLSIFLFPLIYYSHKNVITMLLSQPDESDYAKVLSSRFGYFWGQCIVIIYFLTFYVTLFSYLVGLIANLSDFLVTMEVISTANAQSSWFSLGVVGCFAIFYLLGAGFILKLISLVSFSLLIVLLGISVYLIPEWDITPYLNQPSLFQFSDDILLVLPILTLSFVFFPASSSMVAAFQSSSKAEDLDATQKLSRIVLKTTLLLLVFVLFFVFSCLLSLTPEAFSKAQTGNLNCLSLLSAKEGISPFIAEVGPVVGLAALITSFMGVFFAVQESAIQLVEKIFSGRIQQKKWFNVAVLLFLFSSLWLLTLCHISIMELFGLLISPLVAVFLFVLPCVVHIRNQGLAILKKPSILLVMLTGVLVIFSFKLGTIMQAI